MEPLRNLDASDQVALLFVSLFGLLVLATMGVAFRSLRQSRDEAARERLLALQRDLRALWIGAVLFWVAWVSG